LSDRLQIIEYGSDEYHQAARLRYLLFYQPHHLPFDSIFDPQEADDLHVAIATNPGDRVLAYGRLGQNSANEFKIYQMVVAPEYQRQGLGMRILQALTQEAIARGANLVILNARIAKVPFYQKFGFETVGEVFPSSMTGEPHIKMQKRIGRSQISNLETLESNNSL
jgi:predicted GNAT family N-acyltransferase